MGVSRPLARNWRAIRSLSGARASFSMIFNLEPARGIGSWKYAPVRGSCKDLRGSACSSAACRVYLGPDPVPSGPGTPSDMKEHPMRYRTLGPSGLLVSELCLGTMTFGGSEGMWGQIGQLRQDEADLLVRAALDAGINFIDTANVYAGGESERIL